MIRIEIHESGDQMTFHVEGRLVGAYVPELERCWQAFAGKRRIRRVTVDLQSVTGVDGAGRCLLRLMHRDGVTFIGPRLLMQDVLEEISESHKLRD